MKYFAIITYAIIWGLACTPKTEYNLEGSYSAEIAPEKLDAEFKDVARSSRIEFVFHPSGKLEYRVSAMGNNAEDTGMWRIGKDSLYMYNLGRGPDSAFKLEKIDENTYRIDGPNTFILRKNS